MDEEQAAQAAAVEAKARAADEERERAESDMGEHAAAIPRARLARFRVSWQRPS